MTIVLASIPLMLVALAVAVVPLLVAMRREHRERLTVSIGSAPSTAAVAPVPREALPLAA